jgi:hypothetical protein
MKQGKTEKAVFAKLSTEKVELNLVNDIKVSKNAASQSAVKAFGQAGKAKVEINNATKNLNKAITEYKNTLKLIADAESAAKELGVNFDGSYRSDIESRIKQAESDLQGLQQALKSL